MIRLDSLDVTLDTGELPSINRDRLTHRETIDPKTGEIQTGWYTKEATGLHGFDGLAATPYSVSLRLNAQAMGDRYTDGLSLDTLPELCDRVSSTGLVELRPEHLMDATVRRADPFADVRTDDLHDVPGALRLIGRTNGDASRIAGRGAGSTLYHKLPNSQGKLRGYAKGRQMGLAKHREFCTLYPGAVAGLDGHHRWELEAKSYRANRHLAAMPEGTPLLCDVLESGRTPVSDALDSLLSTWTGRRRALHSLSAVPDSVAAYLATAPASFREDSTALLAALVADLAGGDYTAAQAIVRERYGSKNAARHYPSLRAACEAFGQPEAAEAQAQAVLTLRTVSDRIRAREAS